MRFMPILCVLLLACSPALCSASRSRAVNKIIQAHGELQQEGVCPDDAFFNDVAIPGDEAKSSCGDPLWGKLMIGVDSAEGLADADWVWGTGVSDPFTRLRFISGRHHMWQGLSVPDEPLFEVSTTALEDNDNPIWREMFTINFKCPQKPTKDDFKLEVAVRDQDDMAGDNMLGITTLSMSEILKIQGDKTIDLSVSKKEYKYSKGTLRLFFWYCAEGDDHCEQFAHSQWRMKDTRTVDCLMGCDQVLQSGLQNVISDAAKNVKDALDLDARAADLYQKQQSYKTQLAALRQKNLVETNQTILQSNSVKISKLTSDLATAGSDRAIAMGKVGAIWAKTSHPAQEFANNFKTITARTNVCSSSSKVEDLMEVISEPLRRYVNNPEEAGFHSHFQREKAADLYKMFNDLSSRLADLQTCLKAKWDSNMFIVNSATTAPKCEKLFNEG